MAVLPPRSFTLETKRFVMRPLVKDDASPAIELWNLDETAAEMLNVRQGTWSVADQAKSFTEAAERPERLLLGIFPRQQEAPIGFYKLNFHLANSTFTITHLIGDTAWRGEHLTTETTETLYDYLFNKLGYHKAKANVRPQNKPVLWLMLRDVWKKEGHLVGHMRDNATGERSDMLLLGMLAEDWRKSRAELAKRPVLEAVLKSAASRS